MIPIKIFRLYTYVQLYICRPSFHIYLSSISAICNISFSLVNVHAYIDDRIVRVRKNENFQRRSGERERVHQATEKEEIKAKKM